jgi:hypothetical protein
MMGQMSEISRFILAQFAQELAQLRRRMIAQLGFLRRELWREAFDKRI